MPKIVPTYYVPPRVYFGNGVNTTATQAQDALDDTNGGGLRPLLLKALPTGIDPQTLSFCVAYDRKFFDIGQINLIDIFLQILDAAEQRGLEMSPYLLPWFIEYDVAPDWLKTLVLNAFKDANTFLRGDLKEQIIEYEAQLKAGKAIVVAHSQGNFYANEAYDQLAVNEQSRFSAIAVATPSDHVAGFSPGQGPWTTLNWDIITLVGLTGALPPVLDNDPPCTILHPIACHDFTQSYLDGQAFPGATVRVDKSGPRILSQVIARLQEGVHTTIYHFDEGGGGTAYDNGGIGNNGIVNGPMYVQGFIGTGLLFHSISTDNVLVPPGVFQGFGNTAYFEAMINMNSYPGTCNSSTALGTVFRKRADLNDWELSVTNTGSLRAVLYAGNGTTAVGGITAPGTMPLNTWKKVAMWYDGTSMRVYVDGNIILTDTHAITLDWAKGYVGTEIGNNTFDAGCSYAFDGMIDEVLIAPTKP